MTVIITQSWGNKEADAVILDENKEYVRIELPNGIIVEGAFSEDDGGFIGTIVANSTVANVLIPDIRSISEISELLVALNLK